MKEIDFERYEEMSKYIRESGKVTVNELSFRFNVSESTVRRALSRMAEEKLVKRFYGGAMSIADNLQEPPVSKRAAVNQAEKMSIGHKASQLINNLETVIFLGGTTVNAICPFLKDRKGLRVITNSFMIANELLAHDQIEVIFVGGVANRRELSVSGYLTTLCMKELHADKLFFGVSAVHPEHGLMIDNLNELDMYKSFMNAARERIAVADYSKFERIGTIALCDFMNIESIVTDDRLSSDMFVRLEEKGAKMVVASKADSV